MSKREDKQMMGRRGFLGAASLGAATLAGCARPEPEPERPLPAGSSVGSSETKVNLREFESLEIRPRKWNFDESLGCYWQMGLTYCLNPATKLYEQLAIYVPAAYFEAEEAGSTYVCEVAEAAEQGSFTSSNAPIVLAIDSADFAAQEAPHIFDLTGLKDYLDAGLVYVYVGFRGRANGFDSTTDSFFSGGAPWGVVDIKAAIRYLRYNKARIPGSTSRIVCIGHGSAGLLSVLIGCTGNSELYEPYLAEIGAVTHDEEGADIGDSVFASASWCPIFPAGDGDAAYEWMMGQYAHDGERAQATLGAQISEDLASEYGDYLDTLGLVDADGNRLELDATGGGTYVAGTYYDSLLNACESSLATFFAEADFPVAISLASQNTARLPGGAESSRLEEELEEVVPDSDGKAAPETLFAFETRNDYLDALNGGDPWVTFDEDTGEVRFTSIGAFVEHMRPATGGVAAYDALARNLSTNQLFGVDEAESLHFDTRVARLIADRTDAYSTLEGWDELYPEAFAEDIAQLDVLGVDIPTRNNMYDPLYFVSGAHDGFGASKVAKHWRIRSGVQQAQTTLTQEYALSRLLKAYDEVETCDFALVWNKGFVPAEKSGSLTSNLVSWLEKITAEKD